MNNPIELYYWPTPNGWKVAIALEEMGLPYEVKPVNIGRGEQFDPAFLRISPNNRMPAIIDPDGPDGQPISIFESGAILQYLARKTGQFHGDDERSRVEVEQWLMWQMGGLGPMAGQAHHFLRYAPRHGPAAGSSLRQGPLPQRGGAALRCAGHAAGRQGLRRRRLFHRRHGDLALGTRLGGPAAGHRRVSQHEGVAGPDVRPTRGETGRHLREDLRVDAATDREAQKHMFGVRKRG